MTGVLMEFDASVTSNASPQVVHDVLLDLQSHLEWAGRRAKRKTFRLLELDAPSGRAAVGTRFSSNGANDNGTFHDEGVVTIAEPHALVFEVDSRLDRKHGAEWRAHFVHSYVVEPSASGARITYHCVVRDGNYVPYWLKPGLRRITGKVVTSMITQQMRNLAAIAEEREAAVGR